jgi:hypothetical protein
MFAGLQPQEFPKKFNPKWQIVGLQESFFKERE